MTAEPRGLLGAGDPPPVAIDNPSGTSPFLLIGDHAGNAIPGALAGLGCSSDELRRHIAWDIGVRDLGAALATRLDAVFIHQRYSRLVADCNRDPRSAEAVIEVSDGVAIPGNRGLGRAERGRRIEAVHQPYHAAIAWEIARRKARGQPVALVSLHSFTPAMNGTQRPWQIGVLHDRGDLSLAHYLLDALRRHPDVEVGDNAPYRMDSTDFTVPAAAYVWRIPYVELELRQDELDTPDAAARWADRLGGLLTAWDGLSGAMAHHHTWSADL